ncbi:hypothetical protein NEAUS04_1348 [Nematocida ausubeli]|nr:hypothetical protein NEAUS04_1348 [Nematocida ausubeli]
MTYYTKTNEHIKAHTIVVLCIVGIWMIFGTCFASNECNDSNTAKIKESLKNSNKSDLASAMSDESRNRMLEPLNLSLASKNTAPNSKNHESGTHHPTAPEQKSIIVTTFHVDDFGNLSYIDDKGCRVFICLTKIQVHKNGVLYKLYNDELGNQILIDSSIRPYSFGTKDISSRAHSSQEESILDNPVKETTPKRPRNSNSTSSDDSLSPKKRKSVKSRDFRFGGTGLFIKSKWYQAAFSNLKPYKSEAQSDTTRDKPHDFSYLFTKGGMDSENTKCECSIEKNYENQHQLWHFLTSSRHKSLVEKIECINNLANEMETEKNLTNNGYYYYFFLKDLKKYIETHTDIAHISATYDYTDRSKNNICSKYEMKPETLGEIYEETQTDLKWWANSMSIISKKTEEMKKECSIDDAALKEKLHLILKLPEILRDLVLITPEILVKTKKEMKKVFGSDTNRALCIIEYLYYLVNDDADKMNIAYNEVKALSVNEESICTCITMEVYRAVYNVFFSFYQCAPSTCVVDFESEEGKAEKKEARIKRIFQSHCPHIPKSGVFRLHGKRAIVKPTLGKYNLHETIGLTSNDSNSMVIEEQNEPFLNVAYQCSKDHYHVQLVDNIRHTVKLIPIPYSSYCNFYISRDGSIQRKTHSIRYIVKYIKSILKSTYPEKNSELNVYPFKCKKKSGIWTLIDENFTLHRVKELDKSLDEMNTHDYGVVFYYFEENIYTDYFECIDFQVSVNPNFKTLRIPLFLTNFVLISTIISPYVFFDKKCIRTEKFFKNLNAKKTTKPTKMSIDTSATSQSSSSASPSNNESQTKRSYINYYYSDFLVQGIDDYRFCTAECFSIFAIDNNIITGLPSTVWCTQIKRSIREYTNYCFSISSIQKLQSDGLLQCEEVTLTFLDILQNGSSTDDKVTYGLCIYQRSLDGKEVAAPIMCEKMRKLLSENIDDEIKSKHANWESDILPSRIDIKDIKENTTVFITVKAFNYTQANLGMHYDIIAALFYNNNNSALAP